jgi:hypothetical protein
MAGIERRLRRTPMDGPAPLWWEDFCSRACAWGVENAAYSPDTVAGEPTRKTPHEEGASLGWLVTA